MPFTVDYRDGDVLAWTLTDDGARAEVVADYSPELFVTREGGPVAACREAVERLPSVVTTSTERRRRGWRSDPEDVLRVAVDDVDRLRPVAAHVRDRGEPGEYRCYDVDLTRGFRYCLDQGRSPEPAREPRPLAIDVPEPALGDESLDSLSVDGEDYTGDPGDLVARVATAIERADPDVLVCNSGEVVPTLAETATETGVDLQLGRRPGWQRLAGASTYESYGQVHHSPARYTVPGRAVVDRSNTFFYRQAGLDGCLDLVARSWKPLQELAWASIGNVLTAIQIREARARGVLVPWNSYRHEFFKSASRLHDADRGGHTLSPAVGVHEDVHELDFGSLYPNIICTRNISPETVRCDCHDRADVPGLGYSVCDEPGYLPDVLGPLVSARAEMKDQRAAVTDPDRRDALDRKVEALKWILVACFGYQGFSNAKFGRIECHEAINAVAREILLDAKETFERGGWRVVHGIVDSLWVTAAPDVPDDERRPLEDLAAEVSAAAEIPLEYEATYDWLAFVPRRDGAGGALTKYFGAVADDEGYKYRGIECRQDSTPPFVADAQRDLIRVFDESHDPAAICARLAHHLDRLRSGAVDPADLAIETHTSKAADAYDQRTRTVAALERASDRGLERRPGQAVRYVVVDDGRGSRERVRLASEDPGEYDESFYADLLVRAAESVVSPLGWDRSDLRDRLADRTDAVLASFR
ncbi:type B DNA-directed DNA polymerase [Halorientalis salina]|uniref:type B DNA-directed DNA polymerase n=1 Tax=Halorientalis salina TaxID=2932266 RepID=UPI0010ACC6B7|nr:type B DNA-directed DNA polymerase [Halorientalis salina]